MERGGGSEESHAEMYSAALAAGLQQPEDYMEVILARLDKLRGAGREGAPALRKAFQEASALMESYFPDYIDPSLRLPAYWAQCEALVAEDPKAAKGVWENTLKGKGGGLNRCVWGRGGDMCVGGERV